MPLSSKTISDFQNMIFSWWSTNKRDLPWRRTRDPYRIFVSEIMLQQTQVTRVIPKYKEFIKIFPSVAMLARATATQVLWHWRGMGYNRRALYLLAASRMVVREYEGKFPKSKKELLKLPGVGTYTAAAILVFAYKISVPLVDTNIRKIITHYFFDGVGQKPSVIQSVAKQLLPPGLAWEWHQALMDYAALQLRGQRMGKYSIKHAEVPFRETDRFYRGRIVDRLREGKMREAQLLHDFARLYRKSNLYLSTIVRRLEKEGLIVRLRENVLRLPT